MTAWLLRFLPLTLILHTSLLFSFLVGVEETTQGVHVMLKVVSGVVEEVQLLFPYLPILHCCLVGIVEATQVAHLGFEGGLALTVVHL